MYLTSAERRARCALTELVAYCGSQANLARNIGVTRQAITNWQRKDGKIPLRTLPIIQSTFGKEWNVARCRPDLFIGK